MSIDKHLRRRYSAVQWIVSKSDQRYPVLVKWRREQQCPLYIHWWMNPRGTTSRSPNGKYKAASKGTPARFSRALFPFTERENYLNDSDGESHGRGNGNRIGWIDQKLVRSSGFAAIVENIRSHRRWCRCRTETFDYIARHETNHRDSS